MLKKYSTATVGFTPACCSGAWGDLGQPWSEVRSKLLGPLYALKVVSCSISPHSSEEEGRGVSQPPGFNGFFLLSLSTEPWLLILPTTDLSTILHSEPVMTHFCSSTDWGILSLSVSFLAAPFTELILMVLDARIIHSALTGCHYCLWVHKSQTGITSCSPAFLGWLAPH